MLPLHHRPIFGGNGEIRTHGAFRHDSFQDCCLKPDSATFPNLVADAGLEPTTGAYETPEIPLL